MFDDQRDNLNCEEVVALTSMTTRRDPRRPQSPATKRDVSLVNNAVSGKLKAYYDDIAAQDIPDRFKDLLDRLDAPRDHDSHEQ